MVIADGLEGRVRERAEQLALDGWAVRLARRPNEARELLSGAEVLVLGEFSGSAVLAQELLRDVRVAQSRAPTGGCGCWRRPTPTRRS